MSTPRDAILGRIREALGVVPKDETPDQVPVARDYRQADDTPRRVLIERFLERVAEYRAAVREVDPEELSESITAACEAQGVRRLVVPADLPAHWVPEGVQLLRDPGLSNDQLDTSDGVLTGCALAIAQTGTIILDGGPIQGRRVLTLLPDYHLCVVRADQIVGLVPEAVQGLDEVARTPGRPMTWISGPSATSDIELSRVEGVHGPRRLEVLVVRSTDEEANGPGARDPS